VFNSCSWPSFVFIPLVPLSRKTPAQRPSQVFAAPSGPQEWGYLWASRGPGHQEHAVRAPMCRPTPQVGIKLLDRLTIHTGRTRIGFDRFISLIHLLLGNIERFVRRMSLHLPVSSCFDHTTT
jgi:hypothetical protein